MSRIKLPIGGFTYCTAYDSAKNPESISYSLTYHRFNPYSRETKFMTHEYILCELKQFIDSLHDYFENL